MNPCPCGYLGHASGKCRCTPDQVARYRAKISGPLLDRIDLQIEVPSLSEADLTGAGSGGSNSGETSAAVRERVIAAAARQTWRQDKPNNLLTPPEIELHCGPDAAGEKLLRQAISRLNLSARAYHRVLKVARTIADLAASHTIASNHIAEAIQYRRGLETT